MSNVIHSDHCYAPSSIIPSEPACSSPHGSDGSTPSSSSGATADSDYGSLTNHSPNSGYAYQTANDYRMSAAFEYQNEDNVVQKAGGRQGHKRTITSRLQGHPRGKLRFGRKASVYWGELEI